MVIGGSPTHADVELVSIDEGVTVPQGLSVANLPDGGRAEAAGGPLLPRKYTLSQKSCTHLK